MVSRDPNGFLVISVRGRAGVPPTVRGSLPSSAVRWTGTHVKGFYIWTWGESRPSVEAGAAWTMGNPLGQEDLPPHVTLRLDNDRFVVASDWLGFRQVYVRLEQEWAAVSSSSRVLAGLAPTKVDLDAIANLSLMGWLVGDRTPFAGVTTMTPGTELILQQGRARSACGTRVSLARSASFASAVDAAAALLQVRMAQIVEDLPGAVLQLTGGLDSRVLLGAIAPRRRHEVAALTLAVPGSADVPIARAISEMSGMRHAVVPLDALHGLSPDEAMRACLRASAKLDCAADPISTAALDHIEAGVGPQLRVAGLGGEVTRGFYYVGRVANQAVTRRRSERLATWRLFPNGSVPEGMLTSAFQAYAREVTLDDIHESLSSTGRRWDAATDEFYLWQRMRRWAGTLASAQPEGRPTLNPMLDQAFIAIARSLDPRQKQNMTFLASLMQRLDPSLAKIPLDGRPAPKIYARPGPRRTARLGALTAQKTVRKVSQRVKGNRRVPAGGAIMTGLAVEQWRLQPDRLAAGVELGLVEPTWYERAVHGLIPVPPAALSLLVNLTVAMDAIAVGGDPTSIRSTSDPWGSST